MLSVHFQILKKWLQD